VVVAESTGGTRASGGPGPCRVGGCGRLEFEVGCWERGILGGLGRWCTKGLGGVRCGVQHYLPDWLGLGWGWGRGRFSCASGRRICPPRGVGGGSGVGGRFGAAAVMVLTAIGSDAIAMRGWLPKRPGGHPWRGGRRYGCWEGSRKPWGGSQRGPAVTRGGVAVVMVAGEGPKNPGVVSPKRPGSDPVAGALSSWLAGRGPKNPHSSPRGARSGGWSGRSVWSVLRWYTAGVRGLVAVLCWLCF
jgi:hypothetical protein